MPYELVMLSDKPPSLGQLEEAGYVFVPDGHLIEYAHGRVRQFLDAQRRALLSVLAPRELSDPTEARLLLEEGPDMACVWTEMVIPDGADRAVAVELAAGITVLAGGDLKVRRL